MNFSPPSCDPTPAGVCATGVILLLLTYIASVADTPTELFVWSVVLLVGLGVGGGGRIYLWGEVLPVFMCRGGVL